MKKASFGSSGRNDYSAVSSLFWTGRTGKSLRGDKDAQIVAIYLITSPHKNAIGLYYLPIVYISHDTGLSIEGASKGLQRVSEGGFCSYDGDFELVWVHEMAAWQIGGKLKAKDNRIKWINKLFRSLPKSFLLQQFYERYKNSYHLDKPEIDKAPSKGLPTPSEAITDTLQDIKDTSVSFSSDSFEVRLSELLFSLILQNNPKAKEPNIQKWAKVIDLMIRRDDRLPADIEAVIRWCQDDSFWMNNILSTEKLRKQFDQLWMKMNSNGKQKSVEPQTYAQAQSDEQRRMAAMVLEMERQENAQGDTAQGTDEAEYPLQPQKVG